MKRIRKLDVFPKFDHKFEADARQRTVLGGLFSFTALAIIAVLVLSEVRYFLSVEEHREMHVDSELGGDMTITVNLTFHHVPCDLMTLDAVDTFGVFSQEASSRVVKTRVDAETLQPISAARPLVDEQKVMTTAIDPNGVEKENCPSCYGAERDPGDCCHTCDDVRAAYTRKGWSFNPDDISVVQCAEERLRLASLASSSEGCNLYATFSAPRVTGNVHFIPGRMFSNMAGHMHDLMSETTMNLNLSHVIYTLEFGKRFPGQLNPLEGVEQLRALGEAATGRFSYFVKIIPTNYVQPSLVTGIASVMESNQYSVTEHFVATERPDANRMTPTQILIPGVFISYDISPIKIDVFQRHPYPSVIHFILQLCAVCGGVLTVASLLDSVLFHSIEKVKKVQSGKHL